MVVHKQLWPSLYNPYSTTKVERSIILRIQNKYMAANSILRQKNPLHLIKISY